MSKQAATQEERVVKVRTEMPRFSIDERTNDDQQ